jgi:hypothetical protein
VIRAETKPEAAAAEHGLGGTIDSHTADPATLLAPSIVEQAC